MANLGSLQRRIFEKGPPLLGNLLVIDDQGSTCGGLGNDLLGSLVNPLRLSHGSLALLGGLQPLPTGRVPLLIEDLDSVLILSNFLIEGLMVLLDGPLGLKEPKLNKSNPVGEDEPFIGGHLEL